MPAALGFAIASGRLIGDAPSRAPWSPVCVGWKNSVLRVWRLVVRLEPIITIPDLISSARPGKKPDLDFIQRLDPALKRVDDPLAPANVVLHAVRHADPLFTPRDGGLAWADPVECLFDLHEARLDQQANQFLKTLQRQRPAS